MFLMYNSRCKHCMYFFLFLCLWQTIFAIDPIRQSDFSLGNNRRPRDIVISGNYAYVVYDNYNGVQAQGIEFIAVDISNPSSPKSVEGSVVRISNTSSIMVHTAVNNNKLYITYDTGTAEGSSYLKIYDISSPTNPQILQDVTKVFDSSSITTFAITNTYNEYVYLLGNGGKFAVYCPDTRLITTLPDLGGLYIGAITYGNYIFLVADNYIKVGSIGHMLAPDFSPNKIYGSYGNSYNNTYSYNQPGIAWSKNKLYVSGTSGVDVFDISTPLTPSLMPSYISEHNSNFNYAILADNSIYAGGTTNFTVLNTDTLQVTGRLSYNNIAWNRMAYSSQGFMYIVDGSTNKLIVIDNRPAIATISSIDVLSEVTSLNTGESEKLRAIGTFKYNYSSYLTNLSDCHWFSSNNTVATISDFGIVSALAAGTAYFNASYHGINGSSPILRFIELQNISIEPTDITIVRGNSIHLTAKAKYSDGTSSDITNLVLWSSDNNESASVTNTGWLTATDKDGTATITATFNHIPTTIKVTVVPWIKSPTGIAVVATGATLLAAAVIGSSTFFIAKKIKRAHDAQQRNKIQRQQRARMQPAAYIGAQQQQPIMLRLTPAPTQLNNIPTPAIEQNNI